MPPVRCGLPDRRLPRTEDRALRGLTRSHAPPSGPAEALGADVDVAPISDYDNSSLFYVLVAALAGAGLAMSSKPAAKSYASRCTSLPCMRCFRLDNAFNEFAFRTAMKEFNRCQEWCGAEGSAIRRTPATSWPPACLLAAAGYFWRKKRVLGKERENLCGRGLKQQDPLVRHQREPSIEPDGKGKDYWLSFLPIARLMLK